MIPDKTQWKAWSPLEKATYVAQLATLAALVVTVVFSFLTWRAAQESVLEARKAREDQAAFFIAEKVPNVVVSALSFHGEFLVANLHNIGDSVGKLVDVRLEVGDQKNQRFPLALGYDVKGLSIQKGQSFEVAAFDAKTQIEKIIGFTPSVLKYEDASRLITGTSPIPSVVLTIKYSDIQGHVYNTTQIGLFYDDSLKK